MERAGANASTFLFLIKLKNLKCNFDKQNFIRINLKLNNKEKYDKNRDLLSLKN